MGIYLDQKRRCDNCHSELGTMITTCKGAIAHNCHKEICPKCAGQHQGYCQDCFEAECDWLFDDFGEPLDEDDVYDLLTAEEEKSKAEELRMLDQWNKMTQQTA